MWTSCCKLFLNIFNVEVVKYKWMLLLLTFRYRLSTKLRFLTCNLFILYFSSILPGNSKIQGFNLYCSFIAVNIFIHNLPLHTTFYYITTNFYLWTLTYWFIPYWRQISSMQMISVRHPNSNQKLHFNNRLLLVSDCITGISQHGG